MTAPSPWTRHRPRSVIAPVLIVTVVLAVAVACGRVPEGFSTSPSPSDSLGPLDPISPSSSASSSTGASPSPSTIDPAPEDSEAPGSTDCEYVPTGTSARPVNPPPITNVPNSGEVTATIQLNGGTVKVVLDRNAAPCTVNSFISLAQQKFYDKTRCHRLVDSGIFILQCGDPTGSGTGGPGYTYADELDGTETYPGGVVAMANGGANTNGSQFFFVYDDSELKPDYTVFGKMDDASRRVIGTMAYEGQDGKNPAGGGRPNNPSEITSVVIAAG